MCGNGKQAINTWVFAAYEAPGTSRTHPNISDVEGLSHEIAEWADDPFVDNTVPAWRSALAPQYGCSNALETGDPLVGTDFTVGAYHLQDEAFLSWFARQSPSIAQDGLYTYLGTFGSFAPGC